MASYIHGSAAPKPEQDWREEQLRRRRQQDIGCPFYPTEAADERTSLEFCCCPTLIKKN